MAPKQANPPQKGKGKETGKNRAGHHGTDSQPKPQALVASTSGTIGTSTATACCEVIDLTKDDTPPTGGGRSAPVRERTAEDNFIDLTTIDNPCYDPTEAEARYTYVTGHNQQERAEAADKGKGKAAHRTPDAVTWEGVYANLPETVRRQLGDDHQPKAASAAAARSSTDEYADEVLDQDIESLINLADRVEAEAEGGGAYTGGNHGYGDGICPVCKKGRRVRTIFRDGGKNQRGWGCSDEDCLYEELD